ncbi:hypothetical protein B0H11DRAFT_1940155 [Mycena galericulata]|nr:hypothetical protein B0H11DRAFT_1940155 [Mycena galericulata]
MQFAPVKKSTENLQALHLVTSIHKNGIKLMHSIIAAAFFQFTHQFEDLDQAKEANSAPFWGVLPVQTLGKLGPLWSKPTTRAAISTLKQSEGSDRESDPIADGGGREYRGKEGDGNKREDTHKKELDVDNQSGNTEADLRLEIRDLVGHGGDSFQNFVIICEIPASLVFTEIGVRTYYVIADFEFYCSKGTRGPMVNSPAAKFGFGGSRSQLAASVWVLGDKGYSLTSCKFCLGSIKVATWQIATSVWVLGDKSCNLTSCNFRLGSGRSRSQPGKLRPLFGFWEINVATCRQSLPLMFYHGNPEVYEWARSAMEVWEGPETKVYACDNIIHLQSVQTPAQMTRHQSCTEYLTPAEGLNSFLTGPSYTAIVRHMVLSLGSVGEILWNMLSTLRQNVTWYIANL